MGEMGGLKEAKELCVIKGCKHLMREAIGHALPAPFPSL